MKQTGKCSTFGGINDKGMVHDTGLALYEPHEANKRKEIFYDADPANPKQPTWQRLRTYFPYIAMRYDKCVPRKTLQNTPYKITNPKTGAWIIGFMVDYGPGTRTGRLIDLSPIIAERLKVETDDIVEVEALD